MNESNPSQHPAERHSAAQHLADQLQRQARSLDIGDTPIATVIRRGHQRRGRRRAAVGVAAVVTLAGTTIGTIQLLSKPVSHRVIASNDSVPSAETTPTGTLAGSVPGSVPGSATAAVPGEALATVNRVDSNLLWNVVEPGSSEALGMLTMTGDLPASPPYIAWSTAPGKSNDYLPAAYRSDDGIHWSQVDKTLNPQNDMTMFNEVQSQDGRMFAYGTTAANAAGQHTDPGKLVLRASDDLVTWSESKLPLDLRALKSQLGGHGLSAYGTLTSGPHGLLATVTVSASLGVENRPEFNAGYKVTADGVVGLSYDCLSRAGYGTTVNATVVAGTFPAEPAGAPTTTNVGIVFPADTAPAIAVGTALGAPQCPPTDSVAPTESSLVTWAELGIDPRAGVQLNTPKVFLSTDRGVTFTEVTLPKQVDSRNGFVQQLTTNDSGFIAIFQNGTGTTIYRSPDGLTWQQIDFPGGYSVQSFDEMPDGSFVVLAAENKLGTMIAFKSDDLGATWTAYTMNALLTPADGKTATISLQWGSGSSTIKSSARITAVATVNTDGAAEAGGIPLSKDGVTLTMTQSREHTVLVATDNKTGDELGRVTDGVGSGQVRQQNDGSITVAGAGATFSGAELSDLFTQAYRAFQQVRGVAVNRWHQLVTRRRQLDSGARCVDDQQDTTDRQGSTRDRSRQQSERRQGHPQDPRVGRHAEVVALSARAAIASSSTPVRTGPRGGRPAPARRRRGTSTRPCPPRRLPLQPMTPESTPSAPVGRASSRHRSSS
jgi:hypothetical protein